MVRHCTLCQAAPLPMLQAASVSHSLPLLSECMHLRKGKRPRGVGNTSALRHILLAAARPHLRALLCKACSARWLSSAISQTSSIERSALPQRRCQALSSDVVPSLAHLTLGCPPPPRCQLFEPAHGTAKRLGLTRSASWGGSWVPYCRAFRRPTVSFRNVVNFS